MINLEVKLAESGWNAGPANLKTQLPALSAQSFTDLLSEALSETLSKFGIDPSSIQLTVDGQPRQFSATRQTPVTGTGPLTIPSTSAPVASASAPAAININRPQQHWYASTPADDAYWSKQPAVVQQLREIDDLDARKALGTQLASEGYNIDVPIMIWGWDAGKVTEARQGYGYTWVPSALQSQVSAAPGVTAPGLTPYDPNHPPNGSLMV